MEQQAAKKWDSGPDLIRLLAMFFVVIQHVLGAGGVLRGSHGLHFSLFWLMEITVFCSVNLFAMLSGYLMVYSRWDLIRRMAALYLQVLFYSLLFFCLTP